MLGRIEHFSSNIRLILTRNQFLLLLIMIMLTVRLFKSWCQQCLEPAEPVEVEHQGGVTIRLLAALSEANDH